MARTAAVRPIPTLWTRLLLVTIVTAGALVAAWSLLTILWQESWIILLPFLFAAMAAEFLTVQVYELEDQKISLSFTIAVTMAAVAIQPLVAPLVSLTAAVIHVLQRRQREPAKVLVNLASPVLAAAVAAVVYLLLRPTGESFTLWHLTAALPAVVGFYVVNIGVIVLMISTHTGQPLFLVGRQASWFGPANILLGLTGAFLGGAYGKLGAGGIVLFVVPALLMRFTLSLYARKSQETIKTLQVARNRAEAAEARYRGLFEGAADAILTTDASGRLLDANTAAGALIGVPVAKLRKRQMADFIAREASWMQAWLTSLQRSSQWRGEVDVRRENGTTVPVEWRATVVATSSGDVYISVLRDISERRAVERQLEHQAFHDALTDLPNRALFTDRLNHAWARAQRHAGSPAVLFLDLDRFKVINDSLGHEAGDQLLIAIAQRLRQVVRPSDLVARLSGDEFTILLEDIVDSNNVYFIARRIIAALSKPFYVAGREVFVTASIGIALYSPDKGEPEDLLREADAAMYRAKNRGPAQFEVFDASMNLHAIELLEMEADLRHAIERGELTVYYQPQLDLLTGRLVGMEALVRWQHPTRGLVAPAEFIPLAEETGLILPLGQWVLAEVCRQTRDWHEQYPSDPPLLMSVNVSARQLRHADFITDVASILADTGLAPHTLTLEITESAVMEEVETKDIGLRHLEAIGVQLAIDDFGTGYSSLSYLKRFRVNMLKIDRSFVAGLGQDPGDTAIVRAATTLAHSFGMQVIAEGVESVEQLHELRMMKCERGQGYYFARPLPKEGAEAFLKQRWKAVGVWSQAEWFTSGRTSSHD